MDIYITLGVDEEEDIDTSSNTGLTNDAYDKLVDALTSLGYSFVDGPTAVKGTFGPDTD